MEGDGRCKVAEMEGMDEVNTRGAAWGGNGKLDFGGGEVSSKIWTTH
jgi:hypothetical protein